MELTRECRALRLWLPLFVHGLDAFTSTLDERLDLAGHAHTDLAADPLLELPWFPALSTVVLRPRDGGTAALLDRIHSTSAVRLSATRIAGRDWIRLCVFSHHTTRDHLRDALAVIHTAVRNHARPLRPQQIPTG